jgi:hypothetical protein
VSEWTAIPAEELCRRIEVFAEAPERLEALKIPSVAAVHGGLSVMLARADSARMLRSSEFPEATPETSEVTTE